MALSSVAALNPDPENTRPVTGEAPAAAVLPLVSPEKATWADAGLLTVILGLMLWGLGSYGLYEPHEGHFAGVGREMVLRGDWITPHLNGAPYLNKPPLLYWMIAACYSILGFNEWAARLPLALIGLSGAALAWHWSRQLWGRRAGRMAAAMLSVAAGWFLFSHQLLIDSLLSALFLFALYTLWRATLQPQSRARWAAFHAVVGVMVLAKGLIGIAFPVAVFLLFVLWRRNWRLLKQCRPITGLLIVLAICGPWVAVLEYHNPGTLYYMIVNEHVNRVLDTRWPPDYTVVKVSALGYLAMAAIWAMPWSLLVGQVGRFARTEASRDAVLLLTLGALMPVVLFLPMPARLIYYSLPALAPFVVLAAGWWAAAHDSARAGERMFAAGSLIVFGAAALSAGFWAPGLVENLPQLVAAPGLPHIVASLAFLIGAGAAAAGVLLALGRTGLALSALCMLLGAAEVHSVGGFQEYDNVLSSKWFVKDLRDGLGQDCIWISEGSKELGAAAGIAYYLGEDAQGCPRTVLLMEDDPNRPPPRFPGPKPPYLINRATLNALWNGAHPAVYVTDVHRTDWQNEPPLLPDGARYEVPLPGPTQRRVYANDAAWQRLQRHAGITPRI